MRRCAMGIEMRDFRDIRAIQGHRFRVMTLQLGRRIGREPDRRPLLVAAGFVLVLTSGLGAWPHALQALCPSILIASSNEKAQLMTELAAEYSATSGNLWSGCGPVVTVENVASGDAEHQLEEGWPGSGRPDVWTPAATTWVQLLQSKPQDFVPLGQAPQSIANSPLVVAMPHQMAEALGWPSRPPTWTELLRLAQDPRGWALSGRPEWGRFRLGMTDPRTSTSGLHSLIAAYEVATGTLDPTKAEITAPGTLATMAGFEASVSRYASTAGTFLDDMAVADTPTYISAVAVEEQEVFKYNEGLHSPERPTEPPADWLDSVFPAGPSLVANHPYVVLNAPWVNSAKVRIAAAFLRWLQSNAQQSRFTEEGFRDYEDIAHPPLTDEIGMTGYHPAARLSLRTAGIAAIRESWPNVRKPASVSIVLDQAAEPELAAIRNSIGELVNRDQVAVWAVAYAQLKPILNPTLLDEAGRTQVLNAINSAPIATGPGRLYLTIKNAFESLVGSSDSADINAIVIVTSYRDDGSGGTLSALEREISARSRETPFRIYSVPLKGSDRAALLGIEKASGGVPAAWSDPGSAVRACLGNYF